MKKKFVSFTALLMVFAMMAGCSGNHAETGSDDHQILFCNTGRKNQKIKNSPA